MDLVEEIAAEPPVLVLLEMLGVRDVDVPALKAWSRESLELFWGWPDADRQLELAHSAAEFYEWLRKRVQAARRQPGDDFFGVMVELGLSDEEVCAVAYFLLIAGQETTTQLISAAFHRVIGSVVGDAGELVEAVLRESSSVPTWRRVTAGPVTVGQVRVARGGAGAARALGTWRAGRSGVRARDSPVSGRWAGPPRDAGRAGMRRAAAFRSTAVEVPPMIDLLSFRAPKRVLVQRSPGETRPVS